MTRWTLAAVLTVLGASPGARADEPARLAVERGKKALLGKSYSPPTLAATAYDDVWKHWGLKQKPAPADYDRLFRERYGMHPAPYPNGGLPMGLRREKVTAGLFQREGLTNDCMICHGGSIFGKSYVGLGNASLDYQAFYEEMTSPSGRRARAPLAFSRVRGTTEAGAVAVFLLGYREPDLSLRLSRIDLGVHDDLCEDAPAWWHLKKKKTMYATGGADSRSVRALMQFMMSPLKIGSASG